MATVTLKSVSKFYDNQCILNDINITIEKGEFVVVVGPSGCGKSTLLRLVAGLERVDAGSILINNQCVNEIPPAKRDMAMVFQNYALYPHMTVFDNMAYGLRMRKMKSKEIKKRVEEVSDLLQLGNVLMRKPMMLSGGQRQRVAMGRAIVRSPSVFLFDEPLSNLDSHLRTEMRYEIKKLHQKLKTTCLYVTHDQTEAMTMADRVVILNKGRIEQIGTPRALYQSPETLFVAGFMGHYPLNVFPATLDVSARKIETHMGHSYAMPSLNSQFLGKDSVLVAIRPEHIYFSTSPTPDSLWVKVQLVDDMGADKLVQVVTETGNTPLTIRMPGEQVLNQSRMPIEIDMKHAHLFCHHSEKRLGSWNE